MLKDNNQVKATKECSIKHFIFCYNSAYKVYKDAKYSIRWQLQELKSDHAKAIKELEDKQDRIYYRIDI